MNLWQISKVPQSPLNAILSSLWIRNKDSNYSAPRSYKTEFTSVAESVSSEIAAPIPIPIELVRNLMSKGGWPLMIDQWPILIPMNTNTNINTNTNDPNTNRAGEEFDDWRWKTIDDWQMTKTKTNEYQYQNKYQYQWSQYQSSWGGIWWLKVDDH